MSKERLEEIAYNVGISLDGEKVMVSSEHYDFLYNYAIQQTERVEELEEINIDAITQIDVTQKRNERLEKRVQELEDKLARIRFVNSDYDKINKRYREALVKLRNDIGKIKTGYEKNVFVIKTVDDALIDWEALEDEGV